MKHILLTISLILGTNAVSASSVSEVTKQRNKLEKFIYNNPVGNQDFWLQMQTSLGWENVTLVVGYYDDYDGCMDLVLALSEYSTRRYRCMPANR